MPEQFNRCVFVNCPFDEEFEPLLQAILFTLIYFGLCPRIATEDDNANETRIDKIKRLIQSSKYSVHDLSRCQAQVEGEFARLNMPFELGIDMGCRQFGSAEQETKKILVLEEQRYRYQITISDLAGSDIQAHNADFEIAIRKVRNWLTPDENPDRDAANKVQGAYEDFQGWHYQEQITAGFSDEDIQDYPTAELLDAMRRWFDLGRPVA